MAGHSRWANIKHKKGASDAKKAKMFTKLVKEIMVSAKIGGGSLEANPRLRMAVQNARSMSVPKDTIEKAIKKATGADATDYTEVTYEGYAPHGVAIFVECATDNPNRTVAAVRSYFTKCQGNLGTNGSLAFIFTQKGYFALLLPKEMDIDSFTLQMIDAGVEEWFIQEQFIELYCPKEYFGNVQKTLEKLGLEVEEAALQRIPQTNVVLDKEALKQVQKLIDLLEEDDDIQRVYHNIAPMEEGEQ